MTVLHSDATMARPARPAARFAAAAAWAWIIAAAGLAAFARLLPQDLGDDRRPYLALVAVAFVVRTFQVHLGLTVALAAIVGASSRRWRLAAGASALAALLVARGVSCDDAAKPQAARSGLRVMALNLQFENRDAAAVRRAVRAIGPDLIVFAEYTWATGPVAAAAVGGDYPHRLELPGWAGEGVAIYSRRPLLGGSGPFALLSHRAFQRAVVEVGGGEVAVYGVHLQVCRSLDYLAVNRAQAAGLIASMRADAAAGRASIAAGDFNFTADSAQASALRRAGWPAAEIGGATWWPSAAVRGLPGLRIDHVFVGPGLRATAGGVGPDAGSDHRPAWADVSAGEGARGL